MDSMNASAPTTSAPPQQRQKKGKEPPPGHIPTYDREQLLSSHVALHVAALNGRYREHVSDTFLTFLLTNACASIVRRKSRHNAHMASGYERRAQIAYDTSVPIFEAGLESACQVPGNGHHAAQAFCKHMESFTLPPAVVAFLDTVQD